MKTIVGIDPGLAGTGIGLVTGCGLKVEGYSFGSIRTQKTEDLSTRLSHIYAKLVGMLNDKKPDLMVVEDVFSLERFPKSGILLGKVTGVILLAASHSGIPVLEVSVRESKKILSGNGNADKDQLEKSVRGYLKHPEPIRPFHASDALALALIGLFRY